MFSVSSQPLPLSEACLQCLCASLNAPVVHLEGLSTGPARAALVVYAEQYGDLGVAVGIRSLEGGEVVLMRYREPLPLEEGPVRALELATSYAEGLGFVFDHDMIGTDGALDSKADALDHWQHLVGSDEVFEAPDVASPPVPRGRGNSVDPGEMPEMEDLLSSSSGENPETPVEMDLDELSLGDVGLGDLETGGRSELLLDELAPLEIDDGVIDTGARVRANTPAAGESCESGDATVVDAPEVRLPPDGVEQTESILRVQPPARESAVPKTRSAFSPGRLSKFRRPDDDAAPGDDATEVAEATAEIGSKPRGGSALGRIQIVRKKKSEDGRATARSRVQASY